MFAGGTSERFFTSVRARAGLAERADANETQRIGNNMSHCHAVIDRLDPKSALLQLKTYCRVGIKFCRNVSNMAQRFATRPLHSRSTKGWNRAGVAFVLE